MAQRSVQAVGKMDGAKTLGEAAEAMRRFARELLDLQRDGWQLTAPVNDDNGTCEQAPAGEPYSDPSSVTVEQLQAEFAPAQVPFPEAAERDGMADAITIRAASTIDDAVTLRDAAERAVIFAAELDAAQSAGWRLEDPVMEDRGTVTPPSEAPD